MEIGRCMGQVGGSKVHLKSWNIRQVQVQIFRYVSTESGGGLSSSTAGLLEGVSRQIEREKNTADETRAPSRTETNL